jgi:GNAT superfamily N-acetyltransferase
MSRYLVGLWVLPEHQNSRAATLLLQDAIQLADREHPLPPMYLECPTPMNRLWYEQFGFRGVEGLGESFVMIRNLWGANIPCEADPGLEEIERKVTRCLPILPRHF